jgi:hypothetical protein
MFGFFSFLPFSTSDTVYHNGEVFGFILSVNQIESLHSNINQVSTFILNIDRDRTVIL